MIDPLEIHALADGELSHAECQSLKAALAASESATAHYDAIMNLKDCVREQSVLHSHEDCWRACRKRFDEIDRSKSVEQFVTRHAWALCGTFFVLILLGRFATVGVRGDTARTADLIPSFSALVERRAPKSQGTQEIDQWLNSLMGHRSIRIDSGQLRLVRGATGSFNGRPVTRVDLVDHLGEVSLFVMPGLLNLQDTAVLPGVPEVSAGDVGGVNCVVWSRDGVTLLLVGARDYENLQAVAGSVSVR